MKNKSLTQTSKIIIATVAFLVYATIFNLFHTTLGSGVSALSIFPVALIGWYFGLKWGIVASLFALVLNYHLFYYISGMSSVEISMDAGIPGFVSVVLAGAGAGILHRLNKRVKNDLSEHERYELALQKSEQRFRSQFENMIDGMAIEEIIYEENEPVDWIINDVNPAYEKILKIPREEVIGKRASTIYGSMEAIKPFLREYDHIVKTGLPITRQPHYLIKDRNVVFTAFSMGANQIAVIFNDLTEQEKVLRAEKRQRDFVETMATITSALNETMDMDVVLDIILENMQKFVQFDAADITLIHANRLKMARHIGYDKYRLRDFAENFEVNLQDIATCRWMQEHQAPLIVADTLHSEIWTVFPEVEWIRSYMGFPIIARGHLVGFLNFLCGTGEYYKDFQVDQLVPFTEQVAIAIENTRTFEETRQRSHRHELINQIAYKMTQPAELEVIHQLAVDSMLDALGVDQVGLAIMNPDRKTMTIVADHPGPGNSSTRGKFIPLENNPSMDYVLEHKNYFLSHDAQNDPRLIAVRHFMIAQHIRSILIIPLIVKGEVIGTIGCDLTSENRLLTPEEIKLAEVLTNVISGRIEQERLLDLEKKRTNELAMLHETSLAITQPYDLSKLHHLIVERSAWLLDASSSTLYLKSKEDGVFECKVNFNNPHDPIGTKLRLGEGAVGIVAKSGNPLIIDNYGEWNQKPAIFNGITEEFALLSVPVIWQTKLLGVIQLVRGPDKSRFSENDTELLTLFSSQVAITLENSRLYEEVQALAVLDPLTNAYNRRGFAEIAERELEIAQRFFHPLVLLFLDIDHFKEINDAHGHAVGDQILTELANRCRNSMRNVDVISRHGGEEFLVLLLESDLKTGMKTAKRMQSVIKDYPFETTAGPIFITVSVGVAEYTDRVTNLDTLIHNADMALYKAKSSGRNLVMAFQSEEENQA